MLKILVIVSASMLSSCAIVDKIKEQLKESCPTQYERLKSEVEVFTKECNIKL